MRKILKTKYFDNNKFYLFDDSKYTALFSTSSSDMDFKKDTNKGKLFISKIRSWNNLKQIKYLHQIHSKLIWDASFEKKSGDGLITTEVNQGVMVFAADCVPVLAVDKKKKVCCAVHSGWKGTYIGIVSEMINKLINDYGCDILDIEVFIGPHARVCCYEVSDELIERFNEISIFKNIEINKGRYLNLAKCITAQLEELGVLIENIYDLSKCTICDQEFHSYRCDGDKSGRNIGLIFLKE